MQELTSSLYNGFAGQHNTDKTEEDIVLESNFAVNDFTFEFLCALPTSLPRWPYHYLTANAVAIIPAPKQTTYCSLLIEHTGQVYYSNLHTNTLIQKTRKLYGLTIPMIWALGSPELFADDCPRVELTTAWTDSEIGFIGLGGATTHPLPWFNIRAIHNVHWQPAKFRAGSYSERQLYVHLHFGKPKITATIRFITTMHDEQLEPLLRQTAKLYKCSCWQDYGNLKFVDMNTLPEPPRGPRYDLLQQQDRINRLIIREIEARYQYDTAHNRARAYTHGWLLLLEGNSGPK